MAAIRGWFSAHKAGLVGSGVGLAAGFLFGFGVTGMLVGPLFGAVLAELARDKKNPAGAFRRGFVVYLVVLPLVLVVAGCMWYVLILSARGGAGGQ